MEAVPVRDPVAVVAQDRGRAKVPVVWVAHLLLDQKDIVFARIADIA